VSGVESGITSVKGLIAQGRGEAFDYLTGERLLKLTRILRRILDEQGLRADVSQTMCLPCTGCDLNPHLDL